MQDIDFEALDNAVTKIMDEKKAVADKQERLKKRRSVGRNMDVVNVAHKTSVRPLVKKSVAKTTISSVKKSVKMQDVRPKSAGAKPISRPQPVMVAKKSIDSSLKTAANLNTSASTTQARGSALLRQRRRLHNGASSMPAVKSVSQNFVATKDEAVVKGHYQAETLSTKQADGSETIYQHSEVNYVAKIAPKTTNSQQTKPLSHYNFAHLDSRPTSATSQTAQASTGRAMSLDDRPIAQSVTKAPATSSTNLNYQADLGKERTQSPFLETVKVDKRPLGASYDKSPRATLQVERSEEIKEATLYRDDLRTEEQPSKLSSIIWVILTILAILGAAAGIYLLTVYNK